MAYIKYKEIAKYFNFSKNIEIKALPKYVLDYVFEDEKVLAAYKTMRDHGLFTDKKIVLFDKKMTLDSTREIFTIPYSTISSASIVFRPSSAEMSLFLNSGYPLRIKFVRMTGSDKMRLRVLYNVIQKYITNQKSDPNEINRLINNDFNLD